MGLFLPWWGRGLLFFLPQQSLCGASGRGPVSLPSVPVTSPYLAAPAGWSSLGIQWSQSSLEHRSATALGSWIQLSLGCCTNPGCSTGPCRWRQWCPQSRSVKLQTPSPGRRSRPWWGAAFTQSTTRERDSPVLRVFSVGIEFSFKGWCLRHKWAVKWRRGLNSATWSHPTPLSTYVR